MSKAFTRESDDDGQDLPRVSRPTSALPPGAKNYLTAAGEKGLRAELERLVQVERPAAALGEEADGRRQLQLLDQRIVHLQESLQSAIVVEPPPQPWEQVRFGASVTVRDRTGSESRYRIVGIDEADVDRDWVSWCSPIARALLNARLGERVRFRVPAGEQELEIVAIAYL